MFWSKSKPAAPPVVTSYNPSALEKGKETDRRSSFSSADSSSGSPQSSPIKALPSSLLQQPKATYSATTYSQTESVNEHNSAGLQSFPVLTPNGPRRPPSEIRALVRRYWFIVALALFATVAIIAAIVAVMLKAKRPEVLDGYDSVHPGLNPSSYWIVASGSIINNPYDVTMVVTPTPTPTPS